MARRRPNDLPTDYADMSKSEQMRELAKLSRMSASSGKRKSSREKLTDEEKAENARRRGQALDSGRINSPIKTEYGQLIYLRDLMKISEADFDSLPYAKEDVVIVFGANVRNTDTGTDLPTAGQAQAAAKLREMGFTVIGIPTKMRAGTGKSDYVNDAFLESPELGRESQGGKTWLESYQEQIKKLKLAQESGKVIVFPESGIGTERAKLKEKAPAVFQRLQEDLARMGIDNKTGLEPYLFDQYVEDLTAETRGESKARTDVLEGGLESVGLKSSLEDIRAQMQNDLTYYERSYGEMDGEPLSTIERAIASLEAKPTPEQEAKVRSFDWNKYLTDFYTPVYANTETPQEAEKVVAAAMKKIGGPVSAAEPMAPSENTKISETAAVEPAGGKVMHYITYELVPDAEGKAASAGKKQMSFSYSADKGKVSGEREKNTFDEILAGRRTSTLRTPEYGKAWVEGKTYEITAEDGRTAFVKVTSNRTFDTSKTTPEQWAKFAETERWSAEYLIRKYGNPSATTGSSMEEPQKRAVDTRPAWEIPNNIYSRVSASSDMPDFRAALTNRTNDIQKTSKGGAQDAFTKDIRGRQLIKTKYPVVLDGKIYPSAEHAYYDMEKSKGSTPSVEDMARIIAEKLRQHPRLLSKLNELGGRTWIEAQSHFTGGGEKRAPDIWQGEGLKSGFIRALAQAYDAASADPVGETLSRPEGAEMVKWAQDPENWSKFPVVETSGKARARQTYDVPEFSPEAEQPLQAKWRQMETMSYPDLPSERLGPILRATGAFGVSYDRQQPFVSRETTPDLAGSTIQDVIKNIATRNGIDLTMGGVRQSGLPTKESLSQDERSLDPKYLGRLFDTLIAAAEHIKKKAFVPDPTAREQIGVTGQIQYEEYVPGRKLAVGEPDHLGKRKTLDVPPRGGKLKAVSTQGSFPDVPPRVSYRTESMPGEQDARTLQEISLVLRKISSLMQRYSDPRLNFLSRYSYRFGDSAGKTRASAEIAADMAAQNLTRMPLAEQIATMKPKDAEAIARSASPTRESFESGQKYRRFDPKIEELINPEQRIVDEIGFPGVKPASLVAALAFKPDYNRYALETGAEFPKGKAGEISQAMATTLRYFPGLFTWKDQLGEAFTRSPLSVFSPEFEYSGGYAEAKKGIKGIDQTTPTWSADGRQMSGGPWSGEVSVINLGKLVSNKRTDVVFELVRDYLSQEATLRNETRQRILDEVGPIAELSKAIDPDPDAPGKLIDIKTLLGDLQRVQEARDMGQPDSKETSSTVARAVAALKKINIAIPSGLLPQFRLDPYDGKLVTTYPGVVAPELSVRSNVRVLPGGAIVDLDPTYMNAFGFPKVLPWQVVGGEIIPVTIPDRGVESPARISPNKVPNEAVYGTQQMLLAEARRRPQVGGDVKRISTDIDQSIISDAINNFLIDQMDILNAQQRTLEQNPEFAAFVRDTILRVDPIYSSRIQGIDDITGNASGRYSFPLRTQFPVSPEIATGRIRGGDRLSARASIERPIYSPNDKTRAVRDLILATDALSRLAYRFSVALAYGSPKIGEGDLRPLGTTDVRNERGQFAGENDRVELIQRWAALARTMELAISTAAQKIDPNAGETFEKDGVRYQRNRPSFAPAPTPEPSVEAMPSEEGRYSMYEDDFQYIDDAESEQRTNLNVASEESPATKSIAAEVARYLSGESSDDEVAALRKLFSGQKMGSVGDARSALLSKIHPDPDTAIALIFREAWAMRTDLASGNLIEYATVTYKNVNYRLAMSAGSTFNERERNAPERAVAVLEQQADFPTRTREGEPSFEPRQLVLSSGDRWSKLKDQLEKMYYVEDAADLNRAINGFASDILGDPMYADRIETFLADRYGLETVVQLGPRSLFIREFSKAMSGDPRKARAFINRFQEPADIGEGARITPAGRIEDRYIPEGLEAQRGGSPGGSDDQFDSAFEQGKMYSMVGQNPLDRIRKATEPLRGPTSQRYYHGWRGFGAGAAADAAVLAAKGYLTPDQMLPVAAFNAINLAPQKYAGKLGAAAAVANLGLTAASGGDLGRALMTTTGSILGGLTGGFFGAGIGAIGGSIAGGEIADFIYTDVLGNKNKMDQYNRAPGIEAPRPMTDFNFRP